MMTSRDISVIEIEQPSFYANPKKRPLKVHWPSVAEKGAFLIFKEYVQYLVVMAT